MVPQHIRREEERYRIERKLGKANRPHGLVRCRHLGLICCGIQVFVPAMALNLKQMVKLLTRVRFTGRARLTTSV